MLDIMRGVSQLQLDESTKKSLLTSSVVSRMVDIDLPALDQHWPRLHYLVANKSVVAQHLRNKLLPALDLDARLLVPVAVALALSDNSGSCSGTAAAAVAAALAVVVFEQLVVLQLARITAEAVLAQTVALVVGCAFESVVVVAVIVRIAQTVVATLIAHRLRPLEDSCESHQHHHRRPSLPRLPANNRSDCCSNFPCLCLVDCSHYHRSRHHQSRHHCLVDIKRALQSMHR